MDNKFSNEHHNMENEKNGEENRGPSSTKAESSSIKEDLYDENKIEDRHSHLEIQKKVAENVKGVTSFTSHKNEDAPMDGNVKTRNATQTYNRNNGSGEDDEDEDDQCNTNDPDNLKTTDDPGSVIRDLEKRNLQRLQLKKFSPQARHVLKFTTSLHIREGKGLTVGKLQELGFKKDNAEKIIQDAKRQGMLIKGKKREGKQKQ